MSVFGRIRQNHCICPVIIVGLLGNLVLIILYFTSNTNQLTTEKIIDPNGVPLFLNEPLEADAHRNSLKKQHKDMVRMKLSLRYNGDLDTKSEQEINDLLIRNDNQRHLRANEELQGKIFLGRPGDSIKKRALKEPTLPEGFYDNVRDIMNRNKNQVIPLKLLQMSTPKVPVAGSTEQTHMKENDDGVKYMDREEEMNHQPQLMAEVFVIDNATDPSLIKSLITPSSVCRGSWDLYLLVTVCSDVRRVELREAIRNTWASDLSNQRETSNIVFVLGRPQGGNKDLTRQITKEAERYGDILLLDMEDRYTTLTIKAMAMLHWVQRKCPRTKYILKTDDDVFINVPNLQKELKAIEMSGPPKFMLGHVIDGAKPSLNRQDKWYTPVGQFKGKTFPTYLSGSAYVFPRILLQLLIDESQKVKPFWLEDVYITGMLASNTKTSLIHNSKFEFKRRKLGPCRLKHLISAHEMSPDDLMFVWKEMSKPTLKCANSHGRSKSIAVDYDLHP